MASNVALRSLRKNLLSAFDEGHRTQLEASSISVDPGNNAPLKETGDKLLAELICTDHRPTSDESKILADYRKYHADKSSLVQQESARIHMELYSILDKLSSLDQEFAIHEKMVQLCTDFNDPKTYSIGRVLPEDILRQIFTFCLDNDEIFPTNTGSSPLGLAHVCMPWRTAAFGFPTLWTNLSINLLSFAGPSSLADEYRMSLLLPFWYSKAMSRPISFRFDIRGPDGKILVTTTEEIGRILYPLLEFSDQLSDLHLGVADLNAMEVLSSLPMEQISRLTSLTIHLRDNENNTLDNSYPILFQNAPSLCRISLSTDSIIWPEEMKLPWSQLTHLHVSGLMGVYAWYEMFTQLGQLQSGSFVVECEDMNEDSLVGLIPPQTLSFHHLRDLEITTVNFNFSIPLFMGMAFPSLEFFQIISTGGPFTFAGIDIVGVALRTLILVNVQLPSQLELRNFLSSCRNLEHFAIYAPQIPPSVLFRELTLKENDLYILPMLKSLLVWAGNQGGDQQWKGRETIRALVSRFQSTDNNKATKEVMIYFEKLEFWAIKFILSMQSAFKDKNGVMAKWFNYEHGEKWFRFDKAFEWTWIPVPAIKAIADWVVQRKGRS